MTVLDKTRKLNELFDESVKTISNSKSIFEDVVDSIRLMKISLKRNGKIIAFGNGGSAADAQHFVAEFIGRFEKERDSIPAIALTTDTSIITAIGNDYSFDEIFSRQCEAIIQKNDILFAISTSGNSQNIIKAVKEAKKRNVKVISLTGKTGGKLKRFSDVCIKIPSTSTARIQEVHRIVLHSICKIIEDEI